MAGAFLQGYRDQAANEQQGALSSLQQMTGVLSLKQNLYEQAQNEQLRGVLAASGGDLNKALQVTIQSGNLAGAAKLGPLLKIQNEQKALESISGTNVGTLSADQADQLALRAAAAGHPGAMGFAKLAEQKRAQEAGIQAHAGQVSTPTQITETPVMGVGSSGAPAMRSILNIPEPAQGVIPPEVQAAMSSGLPFSIGVGRSSKSTENVHGVGGLFSSLYGSENPTIRSQAGAEQLATDASNPRVITPQNRQAAFDRLATAATTLGNRPDQLKAVIGTDGKTPVYVPASQAAGMQPAPTGSNAGTAMFAPEALNMTAKQYLAGDRQAAQGFARNAPARIALQNEIVAEAGRQGLSGEQIASKMAEFAGIMSGSRTVGTRAAQIQLASSEALKMMDIVKEKADKFDAGNFVPFNAALKAYDTNTGAPEVRAYGAAINSLVNVYARAINPAGVATVSDKEHARDILRVIDSPQQVEAVLGVLKQELAAAISAPEDVRKATREAVTGVKSSIPEQPTTTQKKYVETRKTKDGRTLGKLANGTIEEVK